MKKFLLSGLCCALLAGSTHQSIASDPPISAPNNQWKITAIASAVVVGCCGVSWVAYEFGTYFNGWIVAYFAEYSHPEVFDILSDEYLSQPQMTERVIDAFGTCKYKCHEAVDVLENLVKRLQKASRHFRQSEKWYWFYRLARARRSIVDRIKANANYAAAAIRSSAVYEEEKEERERLEDRAHEQEVELREADKPTNEVGINIKENE